MSNYVVLGSTKDLTSFQSWEDYYYNAGKKYLEELDNDVPSIKSSHRVKMLQKHLAHVAAWAIKCREQHIRTSWSRIGFQGGTMLAGAVPVPGFKTSVKHGGAATFEKKALKAFAMDHEQLDKMLELMWETAVKAGVIETKPTRMFWNETKGILKKAAMEGAEYWWDHAASNSLYRDLTRHLGEDDATELMGDLMHLKPVIGQAANAYMGYRAAGKTVNRFLATITEEARRYIGTLWCSV